MAEESPSPRMENTLSQSSKHPSADPSGRPRLIFFGDPHGDFAPIVRVTQARLPEAIVLLGDIEARRPLELELEAIVDLTEVWWIPGNHDTDSEASYDHLWNSKLAHRNFHGRVVDIAGYQVGGLGGIFRESIWDARLPMLEAAFPSAEKLRRHMKPDEHWRNGISLRHRSSIFPDEFTRLARQRADILVTHEGLGGALHGQSILETLAQAMGVTLAVHGHLHRDIDYAAEGRLPTAARFVAYGVDQGSHLAWPPDTGFVDDGGPSA